MKITQSLGRALAGIAILMLLACAGCSHSSANHISDDEYKARFGKIGDPPPPGFSDYMKKHNSSASAGQAGGQ